MNTVLITGCNRGIGLGLVKSFLKLNQPPKKILATCRHPKEAKELQELANKTSLLNILSLEVTDFQSFAKFADEVSSLVGEEGLNILVNNAGIPGKFNQFNFFKAQHMIDAFTVNAVAPVILTKALLPVLKTAAGKNPEAPLGSSRAAVVNVSSVLGSIEKNQEGGYYSYRASKSALNAVTRSLSVDLNPFGILALSLHPGWVKTDMGGKNAPLSVDEVSKEIVQLILNLAPEHNGKFLNYDGTHLPW